MKSSAKLAFVSLAAVLSACSVFDSDKVDYKNATKGVSLEVPPDLTQLSGDSRYNVPGGAVTASGFQVGQAVPSLPTAATALGDVRIERAGSQRWLVVNRPADQLWGPIRDFWKESGFTLTMEQPNLGIMETDWAENRAKISQGTIRDTLSRVLNSVYSTPERDRYRTRLERSPSGGTEIYISHRGMVEVYTTSQREETRWEPSPPDPELEAEFLRRLMIKLGVSPEQAKKEVAAEPPKPTSRVSRVDNRPVVIVDEAFDRAWRRVGLALDRTGFTVEDRDRSQGTYFVRYVAPSADKKEPGFFSKLFGGGDKPKGPVKYRINLRSQDQGTLVSVLDEGGTPDASENAQRILQLIADDLK